MILRTRNNKGSNSTCVCAVCGLQIEYPNMCIGSDMYMPYVQSQTIIVTLCDLWIYTCCNKNHPKCIIISLF